MTDREKLIELLKTIPQVNHAQAAVEGIDYVFWCAADHLIANGVTFAKDNDVPTKWIPVTERLPVDWCPVLVMVREVGEPLLGSYRENVWFDERWNTTFIDGAVTHWMPLPEPPKEVKR